MIGFEIVIQVSSSKRQEFLQAWSLLAKVPDDKAACIEQYLFENIHQPNIFLWLERWDDAEKMGEYLKSDRFRMVTGAVEVLGENSRLYRSTWQTESEGV